MKNVMKKPQKRKAPHQNDMTWELAVAIHEQGFGALREAMIKLGRPETEAHRMWAKARIRLKHSKMRVSNKAGSVHTVAGGGVSPK